MSRLPKFAVPARFLLCLIVIAGCGEPQDAPWQPKGGRSSQAQPATPAPPAEPTAHAQPADLPPVRPAEHVRPLAAPSAADTATPQTLFAAFKRAVDRGDAEAFISLHAAASRDANGAAFKRMLTDPITQAEARPADDPARAENLARARGVFEANLRKLGLTREQFDAMGNEQFLVVFLRKAFAGENGLDFWLAEYRQTAAGRLESVQDAGAAGKLWIVRYEITQGVQDTREIPIIQEDGGWRVNSGLSGG